MKAIVKLSIIILSIFLLVSCSSFIKDETVEITQDDIDSISFNQKYEKPIYLQKDVNLIENGNFTNSSKNWGTYFEGGSAFVKYFSNRAEIKINTPGEVEHAVQFFYDGFRLIHGGHYILSFKASSDMEKDISVRLQLNGGDYHAYIQKEFTIDEVEREYVIDFIMEDETDIAPRLVFNMGKVGDNYLNLATVSLKEVKLLLKNEVVEKKMDAPLIKINQIGFLPDSKKTVYFTNCLDKKFYVVNSKGEKVFTGKIERPLENQTAMEYTSIGDFSPFKDVGIFHIETESGKDKSYNFEISENCYDKALISSVNMFYLQRCGMALDEKIAKEFAHEECHTEKARIHGTYDYIDVSGGWHDAGDYGRYVVPGAKAVLDLLLAYEKNTSVFEENGIDLLSEVKYELDWMFKMQREDGAVYHKVTCKTFPPFIMPEEETDLLYVSPVSTCATADFAAIMAYASTIYSSIDSSYSKKCLLSAKKAWDFLRNSKKISFKNPTNVVTGVYPDNNDKDERYLAACALYMATKEDIYHQYIKDNLRDDYSSDLGWADMGAYGNAIYLSLDKEFIDKSVYSRIKNNLLDAADKIVKSSYEDGYQISLDKYIWGSNMSVCNNAMILLMANEVKPNQKYIDCATYHLDYLLGSNALGYCYLTGFGEKSVQNPHHRPSIAKQKAMEGMLIGGPDEFLEDDFAKIALENTPPAKCYVDNAQSYSTNEVTIYWNSPFVYLLSSLM